MSKTRTAIPPLFAERLVRLRSEMERLKLDGYLVLDRRDQYWLTGFTGEDGGVLVSPADVTLLTDGRFEQTAEIEAPWARRILRKTRTPEVTAGILKRSRLARIGFDPAHMNVATHAAISKLIRPARLVSASGLILGMRRRKSPEELQAIRRAIRIAEEAFQAVAQEIRPGQSESQIAAALVFEMLRRGASEPAFPTIVAAGANASLPHYSPTDRKLRPGEPLLIDWGARAGGYVSDLTRMVWTGSIPRELGTIYGVVREAHDRAIAAVRPGVRAVTVDGVARRVIQRAGYGSRFNHALGHGMGLDVHEAPRLGKASRDVLEAGMVITIEPGIYLPGVGGVRIEDDVLVTEDGCQVLTSLPSALP
jgi:Xaa-Pro aminopeptidase